MFALGIGLKKLLFLVFVVCFAALAGAFAFKHAINLPIATDNAVVEVAQGESFNRVLARLGSEEKIHSVFLAKLYLRYRGLGNKLKAGEYQLGDSESLVSLLDKLTSGQSIAYQLTLVEGWNIKQVLAYLAQQEKLEQTLAGLSLKQVQQRLKLERYANLEGLFLAETYQYHKGSSDVDILLRAHQLLRQHLVNSWDKKAASLPYKSDYQALTMASIIEKETGLASERPKIASVFVLRLQKGMRLQTDPTVIYGMGDSYKGNIRRKHLRQPTPYNTYVIKGLPPTPIAIVGREAIDAALHPDKSNQALYFVAKGDGSHYFSETLAQHNKAVRRYQLQRKKDYRSAPKP